MGEELLRGSVEAPVLPNGEICIMQGAEPRRYSILPSITSRASWGLRLLVLPVTWPPKSVPAVSQGLGSSSSVILGQACLQPA